MSQLQERFLAARQQAVKTDFNRMNAMQFSAVTKVKGPVLILAGAGSGKTTVLVNRIANMVKYGDAYTSPWVPEVTEAQVAAAETYAARPEGTPPEGVAVHPIAPWTILAITFTNKAAGELKERISAKLGPAGNDIWAGTFHSTCAKLLRRYADRLGYTSHFTIYDTNDQQQLLKQIYKARNIDDKLLPVRAVLNSISKAKDSLIPPAEYPAGSDYREKKIGSLYAEYQTALREADAMDFDDLLVNMVQLLRDNEDVLDYLSDKFRYIMVDEYQDTNHAQYMFIKLLSEKHRNLCVVGDDDQSIYRFRGATIENILSFEQEYPDAAVIRLEQNYRSTGNILDAANAVIAGNKARKGKNLWTDRGAGEKITLYTAADEQSEARYIADQILDHVRAGEKFSSHAVLYRANALSNALENVFARSGISYRVIGGFRFYDRKEIKDVLAYLHVIHNPADSIRLRRIINEPKRGIGDTTVAAVADIADGLGISMFEVLQTADQYPSLSRSAAKLKAFADMMDQLRSMEDNSSIHGLLEQVLDKTGYLQSLFAMGLEGADKVDNVNELSSSILQYEEENDQASLGGFLEEIALVTDIDSYSENDDKVVLMTLHAAKGLEFDYVYIAGMEEGVFPGNQSIYAGPEEIEEERRLAYVGITRAKKSLTLTNTYVRMLYGQTTRNRVSRFAAEIPEKYLVKKGATSRTGGFGQSEGYGSYGGGRNGYSGYRSAGGYGTPQRSSSRFTDFGSTGSAGSGQTAKPAAPTRSSAYTAPAKTAAPTGYTVGARVGHKAFGQGTILKSTPVGNDVLLEIQFDTVGVKKLMATFAKLELL